MRKIVVLIMLIAFGFSTVAVMAQEGQDEASTEHMTQGELAQMMVRILGLSRFMPVNPSDADCIAILLENHISPAGGWRANAFVTTQALSRVIVLAMGEEGSVENPDDPDSWVEALQTLGVSIDTPSRASASRASVAVAAARDTSGLGQRVLTRPGDRQLQGDVDLGFIPYILTTKEIIRVIGAVDPVPVSPRPATPN